MQKLSAGILAFRLSETIQLQVLLVHPGGPFFKNKDNGVWGIPKGEYEEGDDSLEAAKREFEEETGNTIIGDKFIQLEPVKIKSGKIISAWAVETDFESVFIQSNMFEMEWPPKSGRRQQFPEVDKAAWFTIEEAKEKINPGQLPMLQELAVMLDKNKLS